MCQVLKGCFKDLIPEGQKDKFASIETKRVSATSVLIPLAVINDVRYYWAVIKSFKSKATEKLFRLERSDRFSGIERPALRKLVQLDIAVALEDLRVPPGNRLEALKGDRKGQWSIRINDQFRICFRWSTDGPEDVEIVDYH